MTTWKGYEYRVLYGNKRRQLPEMCGHEAQDHTRISIRAGGIEAIAPDQSRPESTLACQVLSSIA